MHLSTLALARQCDMRLSMSMESIELTRGTRTDVFIERNKVQMIVMETMAETHEMHLDAIFSKRAATFYGNQESGESLFPVISA
jgi:transcriptional antiterminator Rof (Rho-off)